MALATTPPYFSNRNPVPSHCGEPMTRIPATQAALPARGYSMWRCFCGFQMDIPCGASLDDIAAAINPGSDEVQLLVSP